MARKAEPGISYYSMSCDHVLNRKIRLLFRDHGAEGYWVWQNLLAEAYRNKGYYFDINNEEELWQFSDDVVKTSLNKLHEIIYSCIKRGLFDSEIADSEKVLTSVGMQLMYLEATVSRRKKGTQIELIKEFLLVDPENLPGTIKFFPGNIVILPRNNSILPGKNPQSKVKESKVDILPNGNSAANAAVSEQENLRRYQNDKLTLQKELYKNLPAGNRKSELIKFISNTRPTFIEPYIEIWNIFASENNKSQIERITDKRKRKFTSRINEDAFDMLSILRQAKLSSFILSSSFFTFDWIINSESNYIKVLEGQYADDKNKHTHNDQQQKNTNIPGGDVAASKLEARLSGNN